MTKSVAGKLLIDSLLLLAAILVIAGLSMAGMNWAGKACDLRSVALATIVVVIAFVPPLWLEYFIGPMVAAPLATVLWRLGVLLPAILFTTYQIEAARNCVQVTLLACYLMILPLESWLLIRQSRP